MITKEAIAAAPTAELVAFYNAAAAVLGHAQVKKFQDRATAEARITATAAKLVAAGALCPHCGTIHPNSINTGDITAADEELTAAGERLFCHACATEYHQDGRAYKPAAKSASAAEGVARSWADPAVRAARCARVHVTVSEAGRPDKQYDSVRKAFDAFGIPHRGLIKFRMNLKAAGELRHGELTFRVVAR